MDHLEANFTTSSGHDDPRLVGEALLLADRLLAAAGAKRPRRERRRTARVARMLADPGGKPFTVALTDEILRIESSARAARRLRRLLAARGLPTFLGPVDRALLRGAALFSRPVPGLVMPLLSARLRGETASVVLDDDKAKFAAHARRRADQGIRLNVNVLGEAILGEQEAQHRLETLVERLSWPDVDYVSVKISAICSRLDVLAFEDSVERVASRLRLLYRAAKRHDPPKFVNLDMEEYRDLHLTTEVFKRVLSEPELFDLDAGIVLQAYLPDSYAALCELTEWALARRLAGGGRIKVRIVKGANLAMEAVDAELHGWEQAPYGTKAEVDANFKRMLDHVLEGRFDDSVRVGVASHNLFDVAWALVLRAARGAEGRVELEMLEGMAEGQALAAREAAGGLLLYAPIARRDDFESTIGYLVRRLDENTGEENYLRHVFSLTSGSDVYAAEKAKFVASVQDRHHVGTTPRRTQDRSTESRRFEVDEPFANEPDTDFSLAANRRWIEGHLARRRTEQPGRVPVVVDGHEVREGAEVAVIDPSAPGSVLCTATLADLATVDQAVAVAKRAQPAWRALPALERRRALVRVAEAMAARRGETIATMAYEAGKTVAEGDAEVSEAVDFARWYAEGASEVERLGDDGARFDPLGVVVVASPWNFPYAIPAGGVLAALAAGNTVILKPAPEAILTGWLVARHCWEAGVPQDVLQFVPTPDDAVGRRLVTHPDVGGVILTGAWETAQLFRSWRPDLRLHAETSGKNALVITQAADLDAAVRDLVHSAFGHAGQKCSAASLALVEAAVYDDPGFRRRLHDAVTSLVVGPAWDLRTTVGPLVRPPAGALADAFCTLAPGESWLVEPKMVDGNLHLWSPGVKLGVRPGSEFHGQECFGPVLGVMRVADLDEALRIQNNSVYGLTGGIHSLDPDEVERWTREVAVGNAYVNRATTGATVRRQPFGGWKRSSVGPGAKAGGPNYVLTMGRWAADGAPPADVHAALERWWREHFAAPHDPTGLRAEENLFRYVPLRRVLVRLGAVTSDPEIRAVVAAASVAGVELVLSAPWARPGVDVVESGDALASRLARGIDVDKLRVLGRVPDEVRVAAARTGLPIDDEPIVWNGRIELLRWAREQAVSITRHRYGNVQPRAADL